MLIIIIVDYNVLIDMRVICNLILYHFNNLMSLLMIVIDGVGFFIGFVRIRVRVRFGLRILFGL